MSVNSTVINYNGLNYNIQREKFETNDEFYDRCWFIVKNQPTTEDELNELIKLSFYWLNNKYLNSEYSPQIMEKLKELNLKYLS